MRTLIVGLLSKSGNITAMTCFLDQNILYLCQVISGGLIHYKSKADHNILGLAMVCSFTGNAVPFVETFPATSAVACCAMKTGCRFMCVWFSSLRGRAVASLLVLKVRAWAQIRSIQAPFLSVFYLRHAEPEPVSE